MITFSPVCILGIYSKLSIAVLFSCVGPGVVFGFFVGRKTDEKLNALGGILSRFGRLSGFRLVLRLLFVSKELPLSTSVLVEGINERMTSSTVVVLVISLLGIPLLYSESSDSIEASVISEVSSSSVSFPKIENQ